MSAKPVIKTSHMDAAMQEFAVSTAQNAILNHTTEQDMASAIKAAFEGKYQCTWHCFIGRNFACYVTHESSKFIYFYIGQVGVCIFATA